ncbi:hypothetical protein CQW23_26140 [Capsicum baccatum]|uniref:Inositol polyphosphate-related phosphatase domain-containing protein n=1 Tax=Capsicum baccatum TaxID=33114 RepID=A0A2G2VMY5_CAPBA|nr:hypothetical protein CQW23_26140 [Capsicum baccatum]
MGTEIEKLKLKTSEDKLKSIAINQLTQQCAELCQLEDNKISELEGDVGILYKTHNVYQSTSAAYRAKKRGLQAIYGSFEEGYCLLPAYCEQIKKTNPGSHAEVFKAGSDSRFQRFFISYYASFHGFLNGCLPVFCLGGIQLKSKYLGTLLSATSFDADGGVFSLSFGVVDEENDDSWMWFLLELRKALDMSTEKILIADMVDSSGSRASSVGENSAGVSPAAATSDQSGDLWSEIKSNVAQKKDRMRFNFLAWLPQDKVQQCDNRKLKGCPPKAVAKLACGGLAGSTAALLTTPFDVVKTKLQTQDSFGVFGTLQEIGKREGLKEAVGRWNADFDHVYQSMIFSWPSNFLNAAAGMVPYLFSACLLACLLYVFNLDCLWFSVAIGPFCCSWCLIFYSNASQCKCAFNSIEETPELSEADMVVFLGDLNYRIAGISYDEARDFISQRIFDWLRERDQLRTDMDVGNVFQGMREAVMRFLPTYKFERHQIGLAVIMSHFKVMTGEKKQIPAWCDRILYRDSCSTLAFRCSLDCPIISSVLQ